MCGISKILGPMDSNITFFRSTISRMELEKELEDQIEEETDSNEVSHPDEIDTTTSTTTTSVEKTATTSTTTDSSVEGKFQNCYLL